VARSNASFLVAKVTMTVRFYNLVVPLAQQQATVKRATDTSGQADLFRAASGAVDTLIGATPGLRRADVESTNGPSTLTTTLMPGCRISATATRTTTTSRMSSRSSSSADHNAAPAGFLFPEWVAAYLACRRTKRRKQSAIAFEMDQETQLYKLHGDLAAGTYRPGPSTCFVITRPRPREVWAAEFRDRIVHHLLYNAIGPAIERTFIADSCACIPGRGTLYAVNRLEHKVRSITRNWKRPAFYLKMDLANFFVSIPKAVLEAQLCKRIRNPELLSLALQVLWHDPRPGAIHQSNAALMAKVPAHKRLSEADADHGLPIGNLSSQFLANVLLDVLDQFIKHKLKVQHYIRYVDDFILLHESPQQLNAWRKDIEAFLIEKLQLQVNPAKTILQPIERGIDFVGQVIKPWRTTLRRRTYNEALSRLQHIKDEDLFTTANSYLGLCSQPSHGHHDRARIARLLLSRGRCIKADFSKTYRSAGE
jgi:RNA-directed DNA polymerase